MGPGNSVSSILPSGSLSQVPWRRQGVKKAANEIYIDINEEIDGIIEAYRLVSVLFLDHFLHYISPLFILILPLFPLFIFLKLISNGSPTGLKIIGKVIVDCQLSGMPDILLRFGMVFIYSIRQ
jgi:hypothetical protein